MISGVNTKGLTRIGVLIISLISFIIIGYYNFLLFHFSIEFVTSLIGYIMIVIIVNTMDFSRNNNWYGFLGIAFGFIGSIDLLHAITYHGMNIVYNISDNTATQLWIIARYTESISLLIAFKFINRPFKYLKAIVVYLLILIYSIAVIFNGNLFPTCYVNKGGLTNFKIVSEYIICFILIMAIYNLYKSVNKFRFIKDEYMYLISSMNLTILSEVCFTLYIGVYGFFNIAGHIFKLLSFYFMYKPLVKERLKQPYNTIFNGLTESLNELNQLNNSLFEKNKELENIKSKLENSIRVYKDFFEITPIPLIIRQRDVIFFINSKTKELFKLKDKKDIIGSSVFNLVEDGYKDAVRDRITKEKMVPPIKERFACFDGSTIDIEVSVMSILINGEEYFMDILKDISHINKLKDIELKLKEKSQEEVIRNEFFANISHELRTPINVIYCAIQLDEMYLSKKDYESTRKNCKVIKQNCMRLLRLINNIIDITKIDAGFLNANIKCNNIVDVAESVVLSVVPYVKSRKMNIIFDTEFEEMCVNCDSDLIERILLNLLSNSIKCEKPNGTINVNVYQDNEGFVSISVKDNGIGIPKDKQDRVFDRFIRADESLTRNCEGSGIGLSLVKSLVQIQNGEVILKSEENVGTEIIIRFHSIAIQEEVCSTLDTTPDSINMELNMEDIVKKADVEFSDIYEL